MGVVSITGLTGLECVVHIDHYPAEDWPLFHVPEVERPAEWDDHTPQEAAARIRAALTGYTDG